MQDKGDKMFKIKNNIVNENKGFSMVELVIVVAIILVLATVLIPQYTAYVERSRESNDLEIATSIMDATMTAIADPENEIPSNALIRVAWLTANGGQSIEVGSAHDSNLRGINHSNGLSLVDNLQNAIEAIITQGDTIGALSEAGKKQHFVFRVDVDSGIIEVAGENPSPAANGWNAGSNLWVSEIGVNAPLSDEFYFHY